MEEIRGNLGGNSGSRLKRIKKKKEGKKIKKCDQRKKLRKGSSEGKKLKRVKHDPRGARRTVQGDPRDGAKGKKWKSWGLHKGGKNPDVLGASKKKSGYEEGRYTEKIKKKEPG